MLSKYLPKLDVQNRFSFVTRIFHWLTKVSQIWWADLIRVKKLLDLMLA